MRKCTHCWCHCNLGVEKSLRVTVAEVLEVDPTASVFFVIACVMEYGFPLRLASGKAVPGLLPRELRATISQEDSVPGLLVGPGPKRSGRLLMAADQRRAFGVLQLPMVALEFREACVGKFGTWCGLPTGNECDACEVPFGWLSPLCRVCELYLGKCTRCWCRGDFVSETRLRVVVAEMLQGILE